MQRADREREWEKIGFVLGAGSVSSPRTYSYQDAAVALSERLRYRQPLVIFICAVNCFALAGCFFILED